MCQLPPLRPPSCRSDNFSTAEIHVWSFPSWIDLNYSPCLILVRTQLVTDWRAFQGSPALPRANNMPLQALKPTCKTRQGVKWNHTSFLRSQSCSAAHHALAGMWQRATLPISLSHFAPFFFLSFSSFIDNEVWLDWQHYYALISIDTSHIETTDLPLWQLCVCACVFVKGVATAGPRPDACGKSWVEVQWLRGGALGTLVWHIDQSHTLQRVKEKMVPLGIQHQWLIKTCWPL